MKRRLALMLFAIGLPAFVWLTWSKYAVLTHPAWSGIWLALYATGVVLFAFWREIWRELGPRWARRIADWIDDKVTTCITSFLTPYYSQYRRSLYHRHRDFNVRGMRTHSHATLTLADVFVTLKVRPSSPEQVGANPVRPTPTAPSKKTIWSYLASTWPTAQKLAIIGPPGSGKTTLLQHIALTLIDRKKRRQQGFERTLVPLLLFLRAHIDDICSASPPTLAELLERHEDRHFESPPRKWFESRLRRGMCLVMLDGLDEVADSEKRCIVAAWVEQQFTVYPKNRFVITSRPHGYLSNPLNSVTVLDVQPFDMRDVEQFVDAWYLANESALSGRCDDSVLRKAHQRAADLNDRIRRTPAIAALSTNPLLLTMIALVHQYRGTLPQRRVELYSEICAVLLEHWRHAKMNGTRARDVDDLSAAQQRIPLETLAIYMMNEHVRELPVAEAVTAIRESLTSVVEARLLDSERFLERVCNDSGLIVEREAGVYGFAHLTFQEFLAASFLVSRIDDVERAFDVHDPWWHEVIRLYAAQTDATRVVSECLCVATSDLDANRGVSALMLAYLCLTEAQTIDPKVRRDVHTAIVDSIESPLASRRRGAAEAMLSIRLHSLLRLSTEREIDLNYVTNAEYQLFVDDANGPNSEKAPVHWEDATFVPASGKTPVTGVRYSQAKDFCRWLTERIRTDGNLRSVIHLPCHQDHDMASDGADEQDALFRGTDTGRIGSWCDNPPKVVGVSKSFISEQAARLRKCTMHVLGDGTTLSMLRHLTGVEDDSFRVMDQVARSRGFMSDVVLRAEEQWKHCASGQKGDRPVSGQETRVVVRVPVPTTTSGAHMSSRGSRDERQVHTTREFERLPWFQERTQSVVRWMKMFVYRVRTGFRAQQREPIKVSQEKSQRVPSARGRRDATPRIDVEGAHGGLGLMDDGEMAALCLDRVLTNVNLAQDGLVRLPKEVEFDDNIGECVSARILPRPYAATVEGVGDYLIETARSLGADNDVIVRIALVCAEVCGRISRMSRVRQDGLWNVSWDEWSFLQTASGETFFRLVVMTERTKGRLEPCEGIRVVREICQESL